MSKHIKDLRECEIIDQEKVGREIYYHFSADEMIEIDSWLEQFRTLWEDRFIQLDGVLNNLKSKENEK